MKNTESQLIIQEKECLEIENFTLEIVSYLGLLTSDVHYFKVNFKNNEHQDHKFGLLRVGSINGSLKRELELREILKDYQMIPHILAQNIEKSVIINPPFLENKQDINESKTELITEDLPENSNKFEKIENEITLIEETEEIKHELTLETEKIEETLLENQEDLLENNNNEIMAEIKVENGEKTDYLEEETYPEEDITNDTSTEKLLLLTDFPDEETSLATWLKQEHSSEEYLAITTQICQFFNYLYQKDWCYINLIPELITISKPLKFYDLTSAYSLNISLTSGLIGSYIAPELSSSQGVNELMSSYTIGTFLYQCFHQKLPLIDPIMGIEINPIPRLYQMLKISLSPVAEERFTLAQFLSLLVETRKSFNNININWNIASKSTVGLSPYRLQNEDNYGIRQEQFCNLQNLIMGIVADGMGGMAKGEIASKIAVETALKEPIPDNLIKDEDWNNWLINLVEKANQNITKNVQNGGTTLSLVLGINDKLMIAHVGDSRIYLLRENELKQLSEDHSYVAILVASGQITQEESLSHPDRNILTKSLGTKNRLSQGYVQNLTRTIENLFLTLKNDDILLLCSDGVWDLIPNNEFIEIFNNCENLQGGVDETINKIIERGAGDNATLVALKCQILSNKNL